MVSCTEPPVKLSANDQLTKSSRQSDSHLPRGTPPHRFSRIEENDDGEEIKLCRGLAYVNDSMNEEDKEKRQECRLPIEKMVENFRLSSNDRMNAKESIENAVKVNLFFYERW